MTIYTFQRGENIAIEYIVVEGSGAAVVDAMAQLRPLHAGKNLPTEGVAKAADFAVTYSAAAGEEPEKWGLSLSSDTSRALAVGRYYADLLLGFGPESDTITDGVIIVIEEPATVRP